MATVTQVLSTEHPQTGAPRNFMSWIRASMQSAFRASSTCTLLTTFMMLLPGLALTPQVLDDLMTFSAIATVTYISS